MAAPKGFLYYKYKQTNNCSTNLDQLTEVTVGPHLEFPDGSVPMVTKAGSGRMSPVRSRTMKEYDQQLAELKKENFSLKLRIYFLEERMQQKFSGNGEEVFKTNIELKVGVESLKKELQDKQELLRKASSALETISTQHQVELQQAQDQTTGGAQAKECKKRVEELEKLLLQNTEDLQKSHRQLEEANQKLQEVVTANRQLDTAYKQLEATKWQLEEQLEGCGDSNASKNGNASDIEGKEMIITQLKSVIKTKELIIEQLEEEKKEVVAAVTRPLDEQTRHLEAELVNKEHEIQMLKKTGVGNKGDDDAPVTETAMHGMLNDYKHKVALLQEATDKLTSDLAEKDTFISRLEELVEDRDHNNGELVAVNRDHEENALKRDLAIQGLAKVVRQKEKEVQMLSAKLRERRLTDPTVGQQAETADFYGRDGAGSSGMNEEQLGSIEQELREKEMENQRLEEIIASKDAEIAALSRHTSQPSIAEVTQLNGTAGSDHLMAPLSPTSRDRSGNDVIDSVQGWRQRLADKEGEVARLTEKLRKSDAQLRQREDALEALLDDAHRQIHNQEKMLQHISHSLREKDKLLQEYMRLVDDQEPLNETQERVISNLRAALHEKDNVIEETMEDKCQTAATKDTEIRQLRTALRERDSDIERANQMLLSTEEMIDTLEVESRERKQNLDQMTASLSACQRVQQSMEESHSEAMEEKEALIGKLRDSLVRKEEELQELVQQGPDATDTLMQQLQHRLQEKENLLQEVMSDRSRVADLNKDALDKLLSKIAERELEVKTLHERMSRETTDLNRRIQSMQSELKKKDLDMQRSESHMSRIEDDHRHQLEKMRAALNEKDRTIEALVGSGREKDKLFHQVHGSASPDVGSIGSSVDKMAALQELRDEVAQLKNQLLNKDDLIEQLYTKADQRDFDTVPRVELDMSEKEIASKTERNLKKQLKELSNGHLGSDLLLDHERVTTDCLEGQLDRPGCPERTQTTIGSDSSAQVAEDSLLETQKLKAVLEAEADIYESIRKVAEADPTLGTTAEKLETELKQVQSLRQQLAGDITHNQELRAQLSKHVGDKSDGDKSGVANETTAEQLESLRTQLEESQRWNSSLQARLSQQQPTTHTRGGGVGATTTDMTSDMTSTTNDHAMARSLPESSALPSATSLLSYQPDHSAHMGPTSTDDIYEQITQLKLDLGQSRSQNKELRNQLNLVMNRRTDCDDDILGQNVTDASVAGAVALSRKPAFIDLVSNTGNTRDHMMSSSQHDTVPDGPSISTTSCGHDTEPSLIKMSDSGANTSKLVLGTQTDSLNSSKIAPELVTEMAQEIDRLTEELARSRMHELETIQKNGFPEGVPTTAGFPQAKGIAAETGFPQGVSTAAGFQQRVPTKAEFPQGVPTTAGFLQGDSTVTGFSTTAGFLQGNFTATGVSTTAGFPQGIPTTAGFSQGVPTTAGFPQGVPTTAGFPQQDPTTAEFPLGFPTTIGYPQGVPTTAGFSQGDSIATGVLTTSVFPQEVPTTAGFPLEVPTTAGFPQGVPTTAGFPQGVPTTAEFPQAVPTTAGFPQGVSTVAGFPQGVFTAAGCSQGIPTTAGFPQGDSTATGFLGGVSTVVGFPQGVSTMMTANSSYNGPNQPVTSLTASQKGQDRSHSNSIDASLAVLQNTLQVHQPAQKETVAPSVVHRCVQTVEVSETAVQRALQTQTEALKKELEDVKAEVGDVERLKLRLRDNHLLTDKLLRRLESLSGFMEALLGPNAGDHSFDHHLDLTPMQVSALRGHLDETRELVSYLSMTLEETAAEDLTEMDVSAVSGYSHSRLDHSRLDHTRLDHTQLEERYNAAQLRIEQIQAKSVAHSTATFASVCVATEPEEAISDTEKLMAELQRRNAALERRVIDMQRVISEHEQRAQQRHLHVEQLSSTTNGLQEAQSSQREGACARQSDGVSSTTHDGHGAVGLHASEAVKQELQRLREELDGRNRLIEQLQSGMPAEWQGKTARSDSALLIPHDQPYASSNSPHTKRVSQDFNDRSDLHQNQFRPKGGDTEVFPSHKWIALDSSMERSRTQQPDGIYMMSSPHHGILGSPECILSDRRTSGDSPNMLTRPPVNTQQHSDLTQYMVESTPSQVSGSSLTRDLFAGSAATMSVDAQPDASCMTYNESVDQHDTIGHTPASCYDNRIIGEPHMSMPLNVSRSLVATTTTTLPVAAMKAQLAETKEQNATLRKELELRDNIRLPSRTLEQHLEEIRALRLRLEESLRSNDLLREQLQTQLMHIHANTPRVGTNNGGPAVTDHLVGVIPTPGGEGDNPQARGASPGTILPEVVQMHQMIVSLRDDLCVRNCELAVTRQQVLSKELEMRALRTMDRFGEAGKTQEDAVREVERLNKEVAQLRREVEEKGVSLHRQELAMADSRQPLQKQVEMLNEELTTSRSTIHRLNSEVDRLREQMSEMSDLNQTLKFQLGMFEKITQRLDVTGVSKDARRAANQSADRDTYQQAQTINRADPHAMESNRMLSNGAGADKNVLGTAQNVAVGLETAMEDINLSLFVKEIRQLYNQLEMTINNNNLLRAKLEERLAMPHGGATAAFNDSRTTTAPGGPTADTDFTRDTDATSWTRPPEESQVLGQTFIDRIERFIAAKNVTNTYTLTQAGQTTTTLDPMSSLDPAATAIESDWTDGLTAPSRKVSALSPPTKDSTSDTVVNGTPATGQLNSTQDTTISVDNLTDNGLTKRRKMLAQQQPDELLAMGVRGQRLLPAECQHYSMLDSHRPPSVSQRRVGSDLRVLYALGTVDDYELLKKEIGENCVAVHGMEARVKERLRGYDRMSPSKSIDYSMLKELASSIHSLKVVLRDEQRLIALFWLTELPQYGNHGNVTDGRLLKEKEQLADELMGMRSKYSHLKRELKSMHHKLETNNRRKEKIEKAIAKELMETKVVVKQARTNLEGIY